MTEAVVLAGHGSRRDADAGTAVYDHAVRLREEGWFDEVRVAFWKEMPPLRRVARSIESDQAFVVPVLTSEGYFADRVFPRELGLDSDPVTEATLHYTAPVGTHPTMAEVITERVDAATADPASTGVVVVGHGTERHAASDRATRRHAARLADRGRFAAVTPAFLDQEPHVAEAVHDASGERVVVVPFFLANSTHTSVDVPADFDHPGIGDTAEIGGRPVHYTGAVGTEPRLIEVIRELAHAAGAEAAAGAARALTPAEAGTANRLEGAAPTEWGEVRIDHGSRGFRLGHENDADAVRASLASLETPSALRRYVRTDEDGRYRPLTGEGTLPRGWRLDGLDRRGLVDALEAIYPGSVRAHDDACREDLAVSPVEADFERQEGIYADLEDIEQPELAAAAEAVCGTCVRERRWPIGEEQEPQPVEGAIPCPSACPFFRSAARAFQRHGQEAAEAADEDVPRTDLADPANRFRVRYAEALDRPADLPAGGGR